MRYTWLVEKYLEGELSGEALRKFELDILRKPEVAEEVEKIRSMNRFIRDQHRKLQNSAGLIEDFEDLENILPEYNIGKELEELKIRKISSSDKDFHDFRIKLFESQLNNELDNRKSQKTLVRKVSIWMAAVSIAVLFGISGSLLIGKNKVDYTDLYNEFYSAHYADMERSANGELEDPLNEALKAYNNADYSLAFQLMNSIPEVGVSNKYYLYKGITAMELGKFPIAIELFNNLDRDANLRHEGMWLKSLCYLGMKDEKNTRAALNEIIHSDGYYKNMANSLLRQI